MYIPQSEYAEDYKQLHRLMSAFVKADDELRFADVEDEDLFGLIDNYEITAEAVVEQVNHLRRNVDV